MKKQTIYQEHGFEDRTEYLNHLSELHGVPYNHVVEIAYVLGENEDFDGLVTSLEDYSLMFSI